MKNYYRTIPASLVWICTTNLKNSAQTHSRLWDYIQQDRFLRMLSYRLFDKEHREQDLLVLIKSYGVQGFRDRLAALYLQHLETEEWSHEVDLTHVLDVQQFTERFQDFTYEWNWRVFLLGFYLRSSDILLEKNEKKLGSDDLRVRDFSFINLPLDVDEILSLGSSKVNKIDWFILFVHKLLHYHSKSELKQLMLNNDLNSFGLISRLPEKDQNMLMRSFLDYGHAIGDTSFFIEERV